MYSWQPMVEALLQRLSMTACNMTDLRTLVNVPRTIGILGDDFPPRRQSAPEILLAGYRQEIFSRLVLSTNSLMLTTFQRKLNHDFQTR